MFGLRRFFLLDPAVIFLNHGSFGATPRPVFRVYQQWQRELERQPVEFLGRRYTGLMEDSRKKLASYLGTQAETLVYTTNVTVSLNTIARSLKIGQGDEVLSSDHEYGALDRTWRFLANEHGFRYINQAISVPIMSDASFLEELWSGVNKHTRVIFLSHITSPTALIFPVKQVIQRARQAGIITIIDGAHAPGQIPLSLDALGADFYGGNLHKWLCAPKGAGFLYARTEVQHLLKPLVVSWGYEPEKPGVSPFIDMHEWQGTRDISAFLTVPWAIEFQTEHAWDRVRSACHLLAGEAQEQICAFTGLPSLHFRGNDRFAQFVAIPLPHSVNIENLKTRLYNEYRIEVPLIQWNGHKLIRVSIQGYNSPKDVEKLIGALRNLL